MTSAAAPPHIAGAAALVALALRWPDVAPRAALRALLERHGGNASAVARELGVAQPRTVLGAVDALCLRGWLEQTWPDRSAGGGAVARRGQAPKT